ncbi:MAG: TIGR04076 family protein [Candidatus Thorarchaeota archaeon]
MASEIFKCKITVLKRTTNQDLIDEYLEDKYRNFGPCDRFQDNQEFIIDGEAAMAQPPENFCVWAWADIRKDILTIAVGGNMPGLKQKGTIISGCTDWFRPVIFKIERLNE